MPVVGNDGDTAAEDAAAGQRRIRNRELHGRSHARHLADRIEVVALDLAAVNGTGLHGRPFHARKADVDSIDRSAGDLVRHVEVLPLGAHQRPLVRRLDRNLLRIRMRRLRGTFRNLAIPDCAAALRMRDDAVFRSQLRHRDVPLLRGGQQQSLPRFGSGKLQVISAVFNR